MISKLKLLEIEHFVLFLQNKEAMVHSSLQTNLPRQEDMVIHGIIYVSSGNTKY